MGHLPHCPPRRRRRRVVVRTVVRILILIMSMVTKPRMRSRLKMKRNMVPMTKEMYDQQQLLEQIRIKEQRIIHNKFANQEAKDSFAYKKAIKEGVAQFKQNEIRNHSSNKKLRCVKGGV